MNAQTERTPGPWRVNDPEEASAGNPKRFIWSDSTLPFEVTHAIATVHEDAGGDVDANADFIVQACNAHDELLAALRELIDSRDEVNTCDADSQFRADTRNEAAVRNARAVLAKVAA
jgi:hypothetical protein